MSGQGLRRCGRLLTIAALVLLGACVQDDPQKLIASAKDYLQKNDVKAATIELKNALQIDNGLPEARFLLGKTFLASGEGLNAELEFRKALDAKHAPDEVAPQLARALVLQRKNKEAVAEFGDTRLGTPAATADLKVIIASAHAALGDTARAQMAIDAALAAVPGDPAVLLMQARLTAANGNYEQAMKTVELSLAAAPKDAGALHFRGELLLHANQPDAALESFAKAIEAQPGFVPARAGLVKILLSREKLDEATKAFAQLKKIAPDIAETKYLEAQLAYQKKDYRLAKESIQVLLQVAPDDPRFLQLAGAVEFQTNSPMQAEFFLGRALQKSPNMEFARRMYIANYLRSGQPKKALAALPDSIDNAATDVEMLALAGQTYLQNGDAKKAEALFARAAKLDPKDARRQTSLAVAQLVGGKTELAMGQLRDIASADSGTAADLELIAAHLRRKEFDKALVAIDSLEKKDPAGAIAPHLRGATYLALNDPAAARRNFEKALAADPMLFPAAANLAALDLKDNNPDLARSRFEAIVKRDPKHLNALLALADLKARSGAPSEEVAALLTSAIRANPTAVTPRRALIDYYLRSKEVKLALSTAQSALSAIPQSPELVDALGRAQQAAGDANQAVTSFNQLASMQPNSPQAHMRLAGTYLLDKKPAEAEQAWLQALKIQPDYLDAQRALIIFYLQSDKLEKALGIARTVKQQRPKDAIGWGLEADIYASRTKWAEAAEAYRAALKMESSAALAVKLHAALSVGGKQSEAESFAKKWLSEHPKDVAFLSQLGTIALVKKDYPEAEKYYKMVLQFQPKNPLILNNLAWVSIEQKRPDAVELAEQANKIAPNRPAFMDTLALALSRSGEHAKAAEVQKKAMGLEPDNPLLKLQLAKIYLSAGDKKNARIELDQLAALGSKFPSQQEVAKLKAEL